MRYESLSCTGQLLVEFGLEQLHLFFAIFRDFFEVWVNFPYNSLKNKFLPELLTHHRLESSYPSETSELMSMSGEKITAKSAASYSQNLMMVDHPTETS